MYVDDGDGELLHECECVVGFRSSSVRSPPDTFPLNPLHHLEVIAPVGDIPVGDIHPFRLRTYPPRPW